MRCRKPLILFLVFSLICLPISGRAQSCTQQPSPGLEYRDANGQMETVALWACKRLDYSAAWDLLVSAGVAPIRGVTVAELGAKVNRKSRKSVLLTTLEWVGYFAPLVALQLPPETSDLTKGLIAGVPQAAAKGIEFFRGYPDAFQVTPSDGEFVTVYSRASRQEIVTAASGAVPAGSGGVRAPRQTTPAGANFFTPGLNFNAGVKNSTPLSDRGAAKPPGAPWAEEAAPEELAGLLHSRDLRHPDCEPCLRWIVEYYRDRNNEAEAEAALVRGYAPASLSIEEIEALDLIAGLER